MAQIQPDDITSGQRAEEDGDERRQGAAKWRHYE
jgi:hypothetical protein